MRIVALLSVRNEERYIGRCLEHLAAQGVETCLIDNGSTDKTLEIAERFRDQGLFRIEHLPYSGKFDLVSILANEERLALEIDAAWFMHHDADEIRQAPHPFRTLAEGIEEADRQGYNALNFDEFVFLPTSDDESYEYTDYVERMQYYYFYEPKPRNRVNAWKKRDRKVDLCSSGGHHVAFDGMKVFPVPFILRHYIVLSRTHALAKYAGRVYALAETTERGWNKNRISFSPSKLKFPPKSRLKRVAAENIWDRTDPWKRNEFLGIWNSAESAYDVRTVKEGVLRGQLPVPFIVGVARSGTTLLRLMLDAHPELAIPPETHFIPQLIQGLSSSKIYAVLHRLLRLAGAEQAFLRWYCYRAITFSKSWGDFHLPAEEFRKKLKAIRPFTISEGLRCFYRTYAERFGKQRWGDKTPPYNTHLLTIQGVLPETHFIHVIRDGRDVALSLRDLWWGPGKDMSSQAANWLWRIRETRQQAQGCRHYLEIRYEDLVTHTTDTLKRVCSFIDLPYHDSMERYYEAAQHRLDEFAGWEDRKRKTAVEREQFLEIHKMTTEPPQKGRIGRWRTEMSCEEQKTFTAVAGEMLRDLGYEL